MIPGNAFAMKYALAAGQTDFYSLNFQAEYSAAILCKQKI